MRMRVSYSASAMQARTTFTSVELRSVQSTQAPIKPDMLRKQVAGSGLRLPTRPDESPYLSQCASDRASLHVKKGWWLFTKDGDHSDDGNKIALLPLSCISYIRTTRCLRIRQSLILSLTAPNTTDGFCMIYRGRKLSSLLHYRFIRIHSVLCITARTRPQLHLQERRLSIRGVVSFVTNRSVLMHDDFSQSSLSGTPRAAQPVSL
jgi:hypothetical protein